MDLSAYLIVRRKRPSRGCRYTGSLRVTRTRPTVDASEVAIKLDISIPDVLFDRPSLKAMIRIPEDQAPATIVSQVVPTIENAVRQSGFSVTVVPVVPAASGGGQER